MDWLLERPTMTTPTQDTRPTHLTTDPRHAHLPMPEEVMTLTEVHEHLHHWARNYSTAQTSYDRAASFAEVNKWLDAHNRITSYLVVEAMWQ